MNIQIQIDPAEKDARENPVCKGCFAPKEIGNVVCWDCFKYRKDIIPYKYFNGNFNEWMLQTLNK